MNKILIIDDDETCREIARILLNRLGITDIVYAEDGHQGIKLLDRMTPPPNIVITDIFMPNKDGIEMVTALVKRKFAGELIFASGGDPMMLRIAQAMALAGGLSVLATLLKPLDEQALRNVFARLNGS